MTRRKTQILMALAAVWGVFAGSAALHAFTPSGLLEIHQINVQQGESALVVGPNGTTVLLDAGSNGKGAKIAAYFQSLGLSPADGLDYTIAGHMDADHVGGFDEVVQAGYDVLVENWFNGSTKSTVTVDDYKAAMAGTTAGPVIQAVLGDTILLGNGAILTVVAVNGDVIGHGAVPGALNNENDTSIAVLIEYGDFDYIWASDLGGGADDTACTGRSTSQVNVETPLAQAITPGGGWPLLSAAGVDVLHVNHHGSESSTNSDYMNLLRPEVAVIPVGAGQGSNWHHPRKDVVENVLMAQAPCITTPAVELVLQTEEGSPTGTNTSFAGFAVGDIKISTDGVASYTIEATGDVSQGPDERAAAALPRTLPLDEGSGGGGNTPPGVTISTPANGSSFASGSSVTFTGSATDAEDGDLTASLAWTSSLDGPISSGASFSTSTLSLGTHIVTASVTDSGGLSGSDSITVTITGTGGGGGGGGVVLSEVLYDVTSSDDGWEWVELYNSGSDPVDLSGFCLGNGGSDYTYSQAQLSGTVNPGATFVVGGPNSGATNANPSFDQVANFSPDFQNSGTAGDGVALFDLPCSLVNASTVPIDAVVYGPNNDSGLIDETGSIGPPEVGDAAPDSSIERIDLAGNWQIQASPTPSSTPLPAPPGGNTAPVVTLTAPTDGSSFEEGTSVSFTGAASDAEDGDLSASLAWSSDLDGAIGSGASLSTSTLSAGTHTITASVTDSGGLSGSDTITLTITAAGGSTTVTFTSTASEDGWVRESSESSNLGGRNNSTNSGTAALRAGDDRRDRQYKGVVSFDTSSIPDGATITSVTLRLRRGTASGTNPFSTHGVCWIDVHSGGFGGSAQLADSDFEATATVVRSAALSNAAANGDWSEANLDVTGLAAVDRTGTTQLRFYFDLDDNDDGGNDYVGYYSGDNPDSANHPQLVVTYQ